GGRYYGEERRGGFWWGNQAWTKGLGQCKIAIIFHLLETFGMPRVPPTAKSGRRSDCADGKIAPGGGAPLFGREHASLAAWGSHRSSTAAISSSFTGLVM